MVARCIAEAQPEIVFHLAAQAIVRRSYRDPLQTWQSNLMGTVNLLEACRHQDSLRAIVLITTDKVYKNEEWSQGYIETDRLGGIDAYSASKACCELAIDSYRSAFFNTKTPTTLIASIRAGNVIGGGDMGRGSFDTRHCPGYISRSIRRDSIAARYATVATCSGMLGWLFDDWRTLAER